ncbi:hypothetical protein MferCBS31731_000011 [Microsporum ferrugineum]
MASQKSGLSVPPTQNTAPVIKFQCLFTHDIRRKAKRWQDGFLRFHTFNKRVMVYDPSGNLVGDLHWRDRDMLQDGDEFELERGVLVQAGEQLESTVTDLTGLLEKRKPSPTKPTSFQVYPRSSNNERSNEFKTPYPSSGPSSGKLKSLNEVLGIKKNNALTTKVIRSPYEVRERLNRSMRQLDERPAKKRKPSPECDLEEPQPPSPSPPPAPLSRSFTRPTGICVEDPVNSNRCKAPDSEVRASSRVKYLCNGVSKENQAGFSSALATSFRPASTVEAEPASTKGRRKKSSGKVSANQQSLTNMFGNLPTTTLEVAPRKPRNRLIFVDRIAEQQAKSRERRKFADSVAQTAETSRKTEISNLSSALMPRDKNITSYQSTAQFLKDEGNDNELPLAPQQKETSLLGFFKPAAATTQQYDNQHDDRGGAVAGSNHSSPKQQPVTLQRSFSATETVAVETADSPQAPAPEVATLQTGHSEQIEQSAINGPLEKAASDPSALKPPQPVAKKRVVQTKLFPDRLLGLPPVDEPEEEVEQGPWTSEALDLFDWWPPNRPKPAAVSIPL